MDEFVKTDIMLSCYHCGEAVSHQQYVTDEHQFCCLGCQSVYLILHQHKLDSYYRYNQYPGNGGQTSKTNLDYLDESAIADKLVDFKNETLTMVTLYIPAIHCSSCIWLLENLYRLNNAITVSQADFLKKQVNITFKHNGLSLKDLVALLTSVGYEPLITLQDVVKERKKFDQGALIRKIAVAGFCFGNSMLLSFPEYFGLNASETAFSALFGGLNLVCALTVFLYSGRDYLRSAWFSLLQKRLNLDVPLALGMAVLLLRSVWEVTTGTGAGFSDTLCGLVFFLLIGRWVQQRTYYHLSFERDYRSYFPIAVTCLSKEGNRSLPIADLEAGQRILIRNQEIIPADAILLKGEASIDYSFVTGEADPVKKILGEVIYAGGRQLTQAIELEVVKPVSQSYLTRLWNKDSAEPKEKKFKTFSQLISRYFTINLLTIAVVAATFWLLQGEASRAWDAFTAVLIIACPCALALSSPFTLSAALSIFDKNFFYIKNTAVVEQMAAVDQLVFDKTGTISSPTESAIRFSGELDGLERLMVVSVCRNSSHPLSRELIKWLRVDEGLALTQYEELPGKGLRAFVLEKEVRIGSAAYTGAPAHTQTGSQVYIAIDGKLKGQFMFLQSWRQGLANTVDQLSKDFELHLLSGDKDKDLEVLKVIFPNPQNLHFNQLPHQKLTYIKNLQQQQTICMLGDGLNDAGALRQADMGIAVSDDINNFSPGCDAILDGRSFSKLPRFFRFAKDTVRVIHLSFAISLVYNIIGLGLAVQGTLSPLFAAILMPASTITIISFTSLATHFFAAKNRLNRQ